MKTGLLLLVLITLLTGGCRKKTQKQDVPHSAPQIAVAVPVRQDVIYAYEYPSYLEAVQTVNLVARVSGFLEKMSYVPGSTVKKGTLLFVIEPQPYYDQLKAAEAQLSSMEAHLTYAQAQYEKMKEAISSRAVSEIEYIQAESNYKAAQANLQDARAQLNTARTNLGYCYIRAPFDGRVSRNEVDPQNYVSGGLQPVTLATMYKDKVMYAYFNMAYSEYQNLPAVGQSKGSGDSLPSLTIASADDPSRIWRGRLDYSSPNVDLSTGTVTLRAIIDNPREELLSGMYMKIHVPYKLVKDALLVPEASLGTNQAGRFLYIVNKDREVELRMVKTGVLQSDGMREIVSGLTPRTRYVTEAQMNVHPGMAVTPVLKK